MPPSCGRSLTTVITAVFLIAAYLVGSIPFGLFAGFACGVDIRTVGSGNIGATNVLRCVGKKVGLMVFALDFLKGALPVLAARLYHPTAVEGGVHGSWIVAGVAMMAILGHNFPVWLKFRGGKGVATSAGALLAFLPWPLLGGVAVWLLLFLITRYVAVASIGAAFVIPLGVGVEALVRKQPDAAAMAFAAVAAMMVIWRHRTNIQRLLEGREHRFGTKPEESKAADEKPEERKPKFKRRKDPR